MPCGNAVLIASGAQSTENTGQEHTVAERTDAMQTGGHKQGGCMRTDNRGGSCEKVQGKGGPGGSGAAGIRRITLPFQATEGGGRMVGAEGRDVCGGSVQ